MPDEIAAAIESLTTPPAPTESPSKAADALPPGVPPVDQAYDEPAPSPVAATTFILHQKCQTKTNIRPALAKSHRANPGLFMTMPCHHCGGNHPVGEFTWEDGATFATK